MLIREADNRLHKAGCIPYTGGNGDLRMCFAVSSNPEFGGPDPMIAKGHIDDGESIDRAAIREAQEELGLRSSNIVDGTIKKVLAEPLTGLTDKYTLHLFVCKVDDANDFHEPSFETEKIVWLTPEEFNKTGRPNQRKLVLQAARFIRSNL